MTSRPFLAAVLIAVIILSVVLTIRSGTRKPVSQTDSVFTGMAEATANETAKLLAGHGQIVLIRATGCDQCLPTDAQNRLERLLKDRSGLRVVATESLSPAAEEPLVLPAAIYRRLVQSHPDADALVSLAGPPAFGNETLPAKRPKLIAVVAMGDPLAVKPLLENRVVDLAIVPRVHGIPIDKKNPPKTARGWFELEYEVVTSATVATAFN